MDTRIITIILKEVAWFIPIYIFATILTLFSFLLLEAIGFSNELNDSVSVFYGDAPIFFNASLFANNIALLFFAILRMDLENEKILEWKNKRPKLSLFKYVFLGIAGAIIIFALDTLEYFTLLNFFDESDVIKSDWDETKNFEFGEKMFLLLDSVIFVPIVEELYFRQAMLGSIYRQGFPNFAIFFSCVIFGLIHFDFLHIFAYLFSGICFSLLYLKTRSLIPSIIAHSLINLVAFYLILFY